MAHTIDDDLFFFFSFLSFQQPIGKPKLALPKPPPVPKAKALWAYTASNADELTFKEVKRSSFDENSFFFFFLFADLFLSGRYDHYHEKV